MRRNQPIRQIMTTNPMTVQVGQSLGEVYRLLLDHDFHHVPVLDGKQLVGVVTSTDIGRVTYSYGTDSRATESLLDHTRTLGELMKTDLVTLDPNAPVRDAATVLADGAFHAVPVVENDELVGIVTSTDLIRFLLEQYA